MQTLILGIAVFVAAPAPKDAKKAEPASIIGQWSIESMTFMGLPIPNKDGPSSITFTKDGQAIAIEGAKGKPDTVKFTHDAKASPMQVDLEERPGMKMAGIYKIDGDTMTICVSIMGDRPTKFESSATAMLMTLKRISKD